MVSMKTYWLPLLTIVKSVYKLYVANLIHCLKLYIWVKKQITKQIIVNSVLGTYYF